jgi:hypothetical protein
MCNLLMRPWLRADNCERLHTALRRQLYQIIACHGGENRRAPRHTFYDQTVIWCAGFITRVCEREQASERSSALASLPRHKRTICNVHLHSRKFICLHIYCFRYCIFFHSPEKREKGKNITFELLINQNRC